MTKHSKVLALFLAFSFALVVSGIAQEQAEETVVCPVSGKEIKKSEAKDTYEHKGKTYYFCSANCKEAFMKNPEKYIKKEKAETKEVYTCSMHPEVKSDKPGKCPKCGMKLEKKMMHKKQKWTKKHMYVHKHMEKKEKCEEKSCCAMMGMMSAKDMEVNVENLENGIVVKVTSKNAEIVKKIQEMAAKMKKMCKKETEKKEEKK